MKEQASANTDVFDYQDYKTYLRDWIHTQPKRGHGIRSALAKAVQCQGAFVSQVLNSQLHFSLEQAERINQFVGHTAEEAHYFFLLVQRERAGTAALRRYFSSQLEQAIQMRLTLKNRLAVKKTLSLENQAIYYSSWHYAAIHVALSITELQSKEALSRRLRLPQSKIAKALEFLISVGLAAQAGGHYKIGDARLHLPNDSPLVNRHHSNWRVKAIEAMEKGEANDLFYSSVVTLSHDDVLRIKSSLVKWIAEAKAVIRDSKEEDVHCLCLDFFGL